jgi:hypothetical protein
MLGKILSKNTKLIKINDYASSAGTTITTDTIDTQGFEGVMIFGEIETSNAGNYAKARQGAQSDMSDGADLEDTKNVPGDDGDSFLIDIYRPQERYVDVQVVRGGANTAVGTIYALLYNPRKGPVDQGDTIDRETHASPDEGTA